MTEKEVFEPRRIGFLCNWCSYAGADLAGVSRIQYPPNIRIIRVMCSGRIDPAFVLEAFKDGADGVLVAGCHLPSDCHYISGNFKALRRITLLKTAMSDFGIEPQRLRLEWISAAEGEKFASVIKDTSLLSTIGWFEMMNVGFLLDATAIRTNFNHVFLIWPVIALLYFILTFVVTFIVRTIENRFKVPGLEAAEL